MDVNVSDLLTPWFGLAAVLIPLVYIEKWIQSHLYGVGWLLTNDDKSATILYYILLAPGVFVHEVTQWLVAGALNIDTKSVRVWPGSSVACHRRIREVFGCVDGVSVQPAMPPSVGRSTDNCPRTGVYPSGTAPSILGLMRMTPSS